MLELAGFKRGRQWWLLAPFLFIGLDAAPALADVRDEVVANATRCTTIGDDRQWLDCYYGAAQPLRAALGLRAVSIAQLKLVADPPAGKPAPEGQTVRNIVLRNAFGCSADQDQRSWLNCFYTAAEPMRARLGLVSAITQPAPSPDSKVPPTFGLTQKPKPRPTEAQRVTAAMASYRFDKSGIFTVTLQNGQIWRQLASDDAFAHWHAPADHYLVKISKGFWGSHNLEVSTLPGLYKVRRLK